jgi:hypothetical protein
MFRCIYPRLKIISSYAFLPNIAQSHPLTYHKRKLSSYLYIRLNAFSYVINSVPKFQRVSKRPASKVKWQKKRRKKRVVIFSWWERWEIFRKIKSSFIPWTWITVPWVRLWQLVKPILRFHFCRRLLWIKVPSFWCIIPWKTMVIYTQNKAVFVADYCVQKTTLSVTRLFFWYTLFKNKIQILK